MENKQELATIKETTLTAMDIRKQVNLIQEVMKEVMHEGEHYGVIPGCNKRSLLKSGAEKLAMTFRLAPDYVELPGSVESDSFICYKLNCRLVHIPTGLVIGNGRGTCNSKEKKYRTRAVYANKATDEEKTIGKLETRTNAKGSFEVYIVPQDPWDVQNTIYKMACKRALIAAVLNATAASDIFTQDIEDVAEGTVLEDEPLKTGKPPVEMPQEKPKQQQAEPQGKKANNPITEPQAKRLYAIAKSNGYADADIKDFLQEEYGLTSSRDIEREYYDDIVAIFQTPKAKDE